jgi:hypothetical protein
VQLGDKAASLSARCVDANPGAKITDESVFAMFKISVDEDWLGNLTHEISAIRLIALGK